MKPSDLALAFKIGMARGTLSRALSRHLPESLIEELQTVMILLNQCTQYFYESEEHGKNAERSCDEAFERNGENG